MTAGNRRDKKRCPTETDAGASAVEPNNVPIRKPVVKPSPSKSNTSYSSGDQDTELSAGYEGYKVE